MTPQELENRLRIEQQILIGKNNTLLELIDRHNQRLNVIRRELLAVAWEQRAQEQTEKAEEVKP